jgi:hypothetical protein
MFRRLVSILWTTQRRWNAGIIQISALTYNGHVAFPAGHIFALKIRFRLLYYGLIASNFKVGATVTLQTNIRELPVRISTGRSANPILMFSLNPSMCTFQDITSKQTTAESSTSLPNHHS